jgi:hypothetical protein
VKTTRRSDVYAGGFVKVYGDRLAQSSILDAAVATRWVFFDAEPADAEARYRCARSPPSPGSASAAPRPNEPCAIWRP